ncbi:MAG: hypothetical protein FJW30_18410 [Acidobacteria bacterium]|nr:hypothetical protein [Acidobacteriota bacterium]
MELSNQGRRTLEKPVIAKGRRPFAFVSGQEGGVTRPGLRSGAVFVFFLRGVFAPHRRCGLDGAHRRGRVVERR